jgi:hypothetical protein
MYEKCECQFYDYFLESIQQNLSPQPLLRTLHLLICAKENKRAHQMNWDGIRNKTRL